MTAEGLSKAELNEEVGEQLPGREAMSLVNANLFAPINLALAANILSDNSTAVAVANQSIGDVTQTN
jgi:hypothetical protein